MEHWDEANSVEDLRQQLESKDEAQVREAVGYLTLLINKAVREQDFELFHSVLREIGTWVETADGRWIFQTLKKDLPPEQQRWMEQAIVKVQTSC